MSLNSRNGGRSQVAICRGLRLPGSPERMRSSSWLPGSRLPAKSLQVGSACWLLPGLNRSAEFELAFDARAEFGLSRFSASPGTGRVGSGRAGLRRPYASPVSGRYNPVRIPQ